MEQNKRERLMELIALLNRYCDEYYIRKSPSVTDSEYDRLFDELLGLQTELNIYMANSPTMRAGKPTSVKVEKVRHSVPLVLPEMVSDPAELVSFQKNKQIMLMLKPDGVTVKLVYENYHLMEASTVGDGTTGESILHHVYGIAGIPILITRKERLVITGEVFIRQSDFENLKETVFDGQRKPYMNSGNLASDAVHLLDMEQFRKLRLCFLVSNILEGFEGLPHQSQRLAKLPEHGFDVCKHFVANRLLTRKDMDRGIKQLEDYAKAHDIPFDGILSGYNDAAYAKSCKYPQLHFRDAQPLVDPLVLKKYLHFVSKEAMNIGELSKDILENLICRGMLQSCVDIYSLDQHRDTIIAMDGFGEAEWQKLWTSIQRSRDTTFEQFLTAMDIPMIDSTAIRTLGKQFYGDLDALADAVENMFDFWRLPGFGEATHSSLYQWFWNEDNYCLWFELRDLIAIIQIVTG